MARPYFGKVLELIEQDSLPGFGRDAKFEIPQGDIGIELDCDEYKRINEAIDINVPIGCGDVAVFPGDICVGDSDSVIIIPAHLADEVAAEATEMTAYEDFVAEQVKQGESIIGLYPCTKEEHRTAFEQWRIKHKR